MNLPGSDPVTAASALPDRECELKLLGDHFTEGALYLSIVTAAGRRLITYLGAGVERIFGERLAALPVDVARLVARIHPADEPGMAEAGLRSQHSLQPFRHDIRVRSADGTVRWASFRTQPRASSDLSVVWDGVIIDITEQRLTAGAVRRQVEFLAALNQTTLELVGRRTVAELLHALVSRAAVLLASPHAEIPLLEDDALIVRAVSSGRSFLLGDRVGRSEPSLSWRAVAARTPVVVDDYAADPDSRAVDRARGLCAAAVSPIVRGDECVGVLGLPRETPGAPLSTEDIREGLLLARMAALVLHNAGLHEEAVRAAELRTTALRKSEQRFRGLFDRSPIGIGLFAIPDGTIAELNATALAVFRFTRAEIIGRTTGELQLWVDPAVGNRYLAELQLHGAVRGFEAEISRKNGEVFTVVYSGSLVTIAAQPYSLASVLDLTDRLATGAALRQGEERFRVLAEVSPVGIFSSDPAGRTTFVNRRWCELAGLTVEQALGDGWPATLHPADRPSVAAAWAEAVRAGESSAAEFRFVRPAGSVRWLVGQSRAHRHADGKLADYVGTLTDVSKLKRAEEERKTIEAQLRQSRTMESLGTLAGGIAHDFNNILNGTFGAIDLARLELPPSHPVSAWLDRIAASSHRAREIVRQTLTFGRRNAGERLPQRLHLVVDAALGLLRSSLPARVELDSRISPDSPPVLADATQIHQVVLNLCTNAAHALPDRGGKIPVTLDATTVTAEQAAAHPELPSGPAVRLCLADNNSGSGMAAATLEHLFGPFFTAKETGAGTGLGLAVVHGIVKSHAGAILVRSAVGTGSTFEIFFPPSPPHPRSRRLRPPRSPAATANASSWWMTITSAASSSKNSSRSSAIPPPVAPDPKTLSYFFRPPPPVSTS